MANEVVVELPNHLCDMGLHERGQIKALSTAGYTMKRIADVVKCSRKTIINFLRHQEEYGTEDSSGLPD
uniref:HTH_38 domain-containing protein n=1 Tax=Heterorhabditis bacteriophora TaxID=37862 RepID=A0A1I7X2V1_HETBA